MFEVDRSTALTESQRERLKARCGARVTAVAQDHRSQARNRELALARLAERIENGLRTRRRRRSTRPTRAAREERLARKRRRSDTKRLRRRPMRGDD